MGGTVERALRCTAALLLLSSICVSVLPPPFWPMRLVLQGWPFRTMAELVLGSSMLAYLMRWCARLNYGNGGPAISVVSPTAFFIHEWCEMSTSLAVASDALHDALQ